MSSKPPEHKDQWLKVPVVVSKRSFAEERQADLCEVLEHNAEQLRRHTTEWQETVKRMRNNFVKLHPVDANQPVTTATVDSEKIRTLFFEYPSDASDDRALTPSTERLLPATARYQVRFDVSDFQPTSVTVTVELSEVVVRARSTSLCAARVPVLPGVQRHQLRAFLSADGILTVEAPLVEGGQGAARPTSVENNEDDSDDIKRKHVKSAVTKVGGKTPDDTETQCDGGKVTDTVDGEGEKERGTSTSPADTTSPEEGQASAASKEKVGVPIFRDEMGSRRMYLAVQLGTIYRPHDVIIQVIL